MLIALLCAAVHGAALPVMCIVFGQMTDSFVQSGQKFNLTGTYKIHIMPPLKRWFGHPCQHST